MVSFLKKMLGDIKPTGNGGGDDTRPPSGPLDIHKLAEVLRYFPIGDKLQYYPEYQKAAALETIILGYAVNNHFIYSPIDIRYQRDDADDALRLLVDGHEQFVRRVDSFSFLIPLNQEDDSKRGYVQRAELGPRGPFRRGNTITLITCSSGGTLSSIETIAARQLHLESGVYAGHDVVLLNVQPESLTLTDQRQHYRLPTSLPARLAVKDGGNYACTILDFSEESVQLQFEKTNNDLQALTEFRRLTLHMQLGQDVGAREFMLDGVMYRKSDTTLVMKLLGIYKNGKATPLGLVDILNIKASLLRHPATQRALAEKNPGLPPVV